MVVTQIGQDIEETVTSPFSFVGEIGNFFVKFWWAVVVLIIFIAIIVLLYYVFIVKRRKTVFETEKDRLLDQTMKSIDKRRTQSKQGIIMAIISGIFIMIAGVLGIFTFFAGIMVMFMLGMIIYIIRYKDVGIVRDLIILEHEKKNRILGYYLADSYSNDGYYNIVFFTKKDYLGNPIPELLKINTLDKYTYRGTDKKGKKGKKIKVDLPQGKFNNNGDCIIVYALDVEFQHGVWFPIYYDKKTKSVVYSKDIDYMRTRDNIVVEDYLPAQADLFSEAQRKAVGFNPYVRISQKKKVEDIGEEGKKTYP